METRRWVNQSQPQTLVIAVFLFYFNAVFTILLGSDSDNLVFAGLAKLGIFDVFDDGPQTMIRLLLGAGYVAGGYLIANERKWGYRIGVAVAALPLAGAVLLMLLPELNNVPRFSLEQIGLLTLLFDGALFALLVHPQSRDYERIWFK